MMEEAIWILKYIRNNNYIMDLLDKSDIDEAIAELEEAMKPKTCEGCKHQKIDIDRCDFCKRYYSDQYDPKDNA